GPCGRQYERRTSIVVDEERCLAIPPRAGSGWRIIRQACLYLPEYCSVFESERRGTIEKRSRTEFHRTRYKMPASFGGRTGDGQPRDLQSESLTRKIWKSVAI